MYKKFRQAIYPIDHFRITPGLNFKRSSHFSFCGSILSTLMYIALATYFIWQIVVMVTEPITESKIQAGQMEEKIDFSNISICQTFKDHQRDGSQFITLSKILSDYSSQPIPQEYINSFDSSTTDNGVTMYTSCLSLNNGNIGTRIGGVTGLRIDVNSIQKSMDLGPGQLEAFTLNMFYYQYDPENRNKPLERRSMSSKFFTTKSGSESNYHFDYIIYEIKNGYLWNSLEQSVKTLSFTLVSNSAPETPFHDVVNLIFDGEVITNTRSYKKIPDIFSAVLGLQGAIAIVIIIFFGQYFEFKYYENLVNNSKRFNKLQESEVLLDIPPEERQALQKKVLPGDQDQIPDDEDLRLSYFEFIHHKIGKILKREGSEYDRTCENLENQKKEIQEQLDVVNVLYQLKEEKKFKSDFGALEKRISNIEKSLEEITKELKKER